MLTKDFRDFLVEDSCQLLDTILTHLSAGAASPNLNLGPYALTALTQQGKSVNLEFKFGILYEAGVVSGFQAIGRDVSARQRLEEQERMQVLGTLASGVAHDFNNVLTNVLGHAQLLEQEVSDEEVRSTLRIIEQAALDGAETVRRIQEFTGQRTTQKLDLIDVNQAIDNTIELSRPRWRDYAQAKGMHVEIERELQFVPKVYGKAAELREVLVNLLNNALDALPSVGGRLIFRTYLDGDKVTIEVADTGLGMPPEVRRHIFEPFYTTKGVRGTGLGLSVAYGIISRYGGLIICNSVQDVGTTFTIRLPVAQPKNDSTRKKGALRFSTTTLYRGHLLIIDDDANIRRILSRALSQVGFKVETASNGAEGLSAIEHWIEAGSAFDLILSDLGMPGMSGWDVATVVSQRWPTLPLLLMTGWGDQLDPVKLSKHNVHHTLAKPFNLQDVVSMVAALIPQH
jgi:signal transduction histidine kinase/CheY-like chemotaxis protein